MLMKFVVINPGIVVMLKSEMASWFIQGDKSYIALICNEGHWPARLVDWERQTLKDSQTLTQKKYRLFLHAYHYHNTKQSYRQ